jgi:hypothetical protein
MALPGKLSELKEWFTVPEAAHQLTMMLDEEVNEADVLRLALDGHLKLSVNFVNGTYAKTGTYIPEEELEEDDVIGVPKIGYGYLGSNRAYKLESAVYWIAPEIWDLPMEGGGEVAVKKAYQQLTGSPSVTIECIDGVFLEGPEGVICNLQENMDAFEGQSSLKNRLRKIKERMSTPDIYYPALGLPADSILVVRKSALIDLQNRMGKKHGQTIGDQVKEEEFVKVLRDKGEKDGDIIAAMLKRRYKGITPFRVAVLIGLAHEMHDGFSLSDEEVDRIRKRGRDAISRGKKKINASDSGSHFVH